MDKRKDIEKEYKRNQQQKEILWKFQGVFWNNESWVILLFIWKKKPRLIYKIGTN